MGVRYSSEKFLGYTHRFAVDFDLVGGGRVVDFIYSDFGGYVKLEDFINENKTSIVASFSVLSKFTAFQLEGEAASRDYICLINNLF